MSHALLLLSTEWDITGLSFELVRELEENWAWVTSINPDEVTFFENSNEWSLLVRRGTQKFERSGGSRLLHPLFESTCIDSVDISVSWHDAGETEVGGFYSYNPDGDLDEQDPHIEVFQHIRRGDFSSEHVLRQARATVAHELFHAMCRTLDAPNPGHLDLEAHASHWEEIGARNEEALSMLTHDGLNPLSPDDFSTVILELIDFYLWRNGIRNGDPRLEKMRDSMFKSHMSQYRFVMGLCD